ncbi:hypothetical protein RND71_024146 [Anisodus tanguticus]|uniref:HMA domain-containing protein n=1 Tax=Anisodus tanguticus TaxID=243964 RepID=A0AAE1RMQ2_9SOLA|nr:hypothetical protein RND71_024146 [Anisodus tanguticus]
MEGKRLNTQPLTLLRKIKGFTRSIVEDLARGRAPLIYIDRFRNYCNDTSGNCSGLSTGKEVISLKRECHARRLEQSVVDRAINDICILLQCSRHNLNVVSVGNGLVMGWLRYVESGRKIDCISNPNTAYPIPVHVEEIMAVVVTPLMLEQDIISVAQYVLVVEKESVFQRLANDQFCKRNRCIVITGRGYPDIPTRRFLRLLTDKLHLPVYCLVDCDPYGFDILTTYKFGSLGCILKVDVHCDACKMKMVDVLSSICGVYSVTIDSEDGTAKISGEVDPNLLLRALSRSGLGNHAEVQWVRLKHPMLSNSHMADGYGSYNHGYGSYNHGYGSYNHGHGYHNSYGHGRGHGYSSIGGPFRQRSSLPEYSYGYDGHHNYQYPFRGIGADSYATNYYSGALPPPSFVNINCTSAFLDYNFRPAL